MQIPNYWVATITTDHAAKAHDLDILQINHGKNGPLNRMHPGDGVVIYSPRESYPDGALLRAFTAIGRVAEGAVYQGDMGCGFKPFRRDVRWTAARSAPIRPLLDKIKLTAGKTN